MKQQQKCNRPHTHTDTHAHNKHIYCIYKLNPLGEQRTTTIPFLPNHICVLYNRIIEMYIPYMYINVCLYNVIWYLVNNHIYVYIYISQSISTRISSFIQKKLSCKCCTPLLNIINPSTPLDKKFRNRVKLQKKYLFVFTIELGIVNLYIYIYMYT